jgi:hypothetical protein
MENFDVSQPSKMLECEEEYRRGSCNSNNTGGLNPKSVEKNLRNYIRHALTY